MPTILKFRRFTTVDTATVTGAVGELTIDMDKDTVVVHDGATAGGKPLATEQLLDDTLTNSYDTSTVVDGKIATAISDKVTQTELSTLIADYDTSTQVDFKVSTAVSNLVDSAPGTLDTLNELAAALADDHDYATTITNALALKANITDVDDALALKVDDTEMPLKADLESPQFTGTPEAPTAAVDTNTTQIATTAFTIAQIASAIQTELPAGFIGMWSGSVVAIPAGWALCDGTNGTPNLVDRFIVGAGNFYVPGAVGGAETVTLTTNELPAHTHTGTTDSNGSHNHLIANTDIVAAGADLTASNFLADNGNIGTSSNYNLGGSTTTATIGNTSTNGAHTHTFTTNSEGSGNAFDILPPYYALAYIMKTYPVSI